MSDRKLTDSDRREHGTHIVLGPGVRLSAVEAALGRSGLAVIRDVATGRCVVHEIPPLIACRYGRAR